MLIHHDFVQEIVCHFKYKHNPRLFSIANCNYHFSMALMLCIYLSLHSLHALFKLVYAKLRWPPAKAAPGGADHPTPSLAPASRAEASPAFAEPTKPAQIAAQTHYHRSYIFAANGGPVRAARRAGHMAGPRRHPARSSPGSRPASPAAPALTGAHRDVERKSPRRASNHGGRPVTLAGRRLLRCRRLAVGLSAPRRPGPALAVAVLAVEAGRR